MGERERPGMTKYQLCLLVVVACFSLIGCNENEDFKTVIGEVFGVNEIPTSELLVPKDDVFFLLGNTFLNTNGFRNEVGILNNDEDKSLDPESLGLWFVLFQADFPQHGVIFPDEPRIGVDGFGTDGSMVYLPNTGFRGVDRMRYYLGKQRMGESLMLSVTPATVEFRVGPLVWYVDNTKTAGDGSQKSPFSTLAEAIAKAEENDIIFVFSGDGTSKGLDTPVTLKSGQRLMGEGVGLAVNVGLNTPVVINPETTPARTTIPIGTPARLTGPVVLSDNCIVEGLTFSQSPGDTILGQSIQNAIVRKNTFQGGTGLVLKLTNCSGNVGFTQNSIQEPGTSMINCLQADFQAQTATIDISNNTFADGAVTDPANTIGLSASGTSNITVSLNGNTLTTPDSSATYDRFLQATADQSSTLTVSALQNVLPVQTTGFEVSSLNTSLLNCTFSQNTVTASNDGISLTSSSSGQNSVTATANQITINQTALASDESDSFSPLEFKTNDTQLSVTASGNSLTGGLDGIFLLAIGGTVSATMDSNTLINQQFKPFFMRTAASADATLRILGNTLTNQPANDGVEIRSTEDSRLKLAYRNNIGLVAFLAASNSSSFCLDATGNSWTDLSLEGALTAMLTVERLDAPNGGPLEAVNTVAGAVSVSGNATATAAGACNIE